MKDLSGKPARDLGTKAWSADGDEAGGMTGGIAGGQAQVEADIGLVGLASADEMGGTGLANPSGGSGETLSPTVLVEQQRGPVPFTAP